MPRVIKFRSTDYVKPMNLSMVVYFFISFIVSHDRESKILDPRDALSNVHFIISTVMSIHPSDASRNILFFY